MSLDVQLIPQSIIFNIASMGVRLIPRGKQQTFIVGDDLYELFNTMYKDIHPDFTHEDFIVALKQIFPAYKNPRKDTELYKISTYKLEARLRVLGMNHFPINMLVSRDGLKIEM